MEQFFRLNLRAVNDLLLEGYSAKRGERVKCLVDGLREAADVASAEEVVLELVAEVDHAMEKIERDGEAQLSRVAELAEARVAGALPGNSLGEIFRRFLELLRETLVPRFALV
ncbi:MAG: hypothetical protein Kow0069_07740 [Promethearchaeota archaeon]